MSPTMKSAGSAVVCASASAQRRRSATPARANRVFMLRSPHTLTSRLWSAGQETHALHYLRTGGFASAGGHLRVGVTTPIARSTELARNVVVERDTHQDDEKGDAHLLPEDLCAFRQRTALEPFHQLKQDLAAVEDRNGQQVKKPQRQ